MAVGELERRFTAMYEAHYDDVARYVRRRAPDLDLADVLAKVFLAAWQRCPEIPAGTALPWLYRTAGFVLANEMRGRRRAARLYDRVRSNPAPSHADHADDVVDRLALWEEFHRLDPRDQEVLRLIAWEGLSVGEAATVLGLRRTTVAMRVSRLRRRLRHLRAAAPDPSPRHVTERSTS
jgi:RNA polymerase sigma factor (sigma-70 family)